MVGVYEHYLNESGAIPSVILALWAPFSVLPFHAAHAQSDPGVLWAEALIGYGNAPLPNQLHLQVWMSLTEFLKIIEV